MKILHIMKNEKFTKSVSEFYDKHFYDKGHEICYIHNYGEDSLIKCELVIKQHEIFWHRKSIKNAYVFYTMLNKYDYIVFHSYQFYWYIKMLLFLNPNLLRKVIWIEWGADLYSWKIESKGIKTNFINYIGKIIRTECNSVVCIFPPDCDVYRKEFPNSKAKVFYAPYCGGTTVNKEYLNYSKLSQLENSKKNNEPIYIQIGHSATRQVGHIEVLDMLKEFSNQNIKLLLPLSYGDMDYADEVQKYAEENFPEKVICLREMLPVTEYFKLINRVDIAIFNTYRQIALGNINKMIFRNVKLYMPQNSVMYKYFIENGVPIQTLESIKDGDFNSFISNVESEDKNKFYEFLSHYSDMDRNIALWEHVYNNLQSD